MLQIRGLVLQLSDAQQQLSQREAEIHKLREQLETIRGALSRAVRKS
jgi:predicted  nucleic acid-binding Zn-ribbon protein